MLTESITSSIRESEANHDRVSLQAVLHTLSEEKRLLIRNSVFAAAVAVVVALLIPPSYTAEAVLLTPQQAPSALSAMAQLSGGGAAGLSTLGLLAGFDMHNPTDTFIGILESRTVADALISRYDLKRVYKVKDFFAARKRLARNTTIKSGKDTLIHIKVDDRDPKRAAAIAQAYVDELAQMNAGVALSEASRRRIFFEQQLAKEKDALADAEVALKDTEQDTGLVAPTGQADALVRSIAQLQAGILSREAQLSAIRTYLTDDNPRIQAAARVLATLRGELAKLEQGRHDPGSPELAAGELPKAGLEYIRRYREVKYHETLFEILSKQYEAARLDEARAGPVAQLIDRPLPPERKSWPPRTLIVVAFVFFAGLASAFWIVVKTHSSVFAS